MSTALSTLDTRAFFDNLRKSELLQEHEVAAWQAKRSLPEDPHKLARVMVRHQVLTNFQAEQMLQGREFNFKVGSYIILDLLGAGSKGSLYLAEHRAMQRRVALKLLNHDRTDSRLSLERFYREGRVTASLNHPNIVKLYDFAEVDDQPALMMEYVEGKTLQQIIKANGPLPVHQAVDYIRQAAAGLKHAHSRNVIHRDIKPSNLMLDKFGAIKILDMGYSRFMDDEQMNITKMYDPTSVVGTVDYVAPEQALGEQADSRCDLYSLGATFFTLLTGRPPFVGTAYQVLMAHQIEEAPAPSKLNKTLPLALNAIVAKMLAKIPAARYQSADEIIQALAPWADKKAAKCPPTVPAASIVTDTVPSHTVEVIATPRKKSQLAPQAVQVAPSKPKSKKKKPSKGNKTFVVSVFAVLAALATAAVVYWLW